MTEQQMPARIWAEKTPHGYWWTIEPIVDTTSYTRSDIAERMAEALADADSFFDGSESDNCPTHQIIRSALSAFRSATQDTEARHD